MNETLVFIGKAVLLICTGVVVVDIIAAVICISFAGFLMFSDRKEPRCAKCGGSDIGKSYQKSELAPQVTSGYGVLARSGGGVNEYFLMCCRTCSFTWQEELKK